MVCMRGSVYVSAFTALCNVLFVSNFQLLSERICILVENSTDPYPLLLAISLICVIYCACMLYSVIVCMRVRCMCSVLYER